MSSPLVGARRLVDDVVVRWRNGSAEGQRVVLGLMLLLSGLLFAGSLIEYMAFPAFTFTVPLILGSLTLRYRQLLTLTLFVTVLVVITATRESVSNGLTLGRTSSLVTMAVIVAIFLFESSRRRSGLPGPVGEAMLVDLNNRLQRQGLVPPLPDGWQAQSAMRSAGGAKFSGDFMVANLSRDRSHLEMVLVDVCGKGVTAGTQSLQLAGALGGLIGSLPPRGLFAAANDYLLRQDWLEGFATAIHVWVDLDSGRYSIISAGHPPVLHWVGKDDGWKVDDARGVALGLLEQPEFEEIGGILVHGDALLFYTDGVVETRSRSVTEGLPWLSDRAREALLVGFDGAASRVLDRVTQQDDDRAVLILSRA